MLPTSCEFFYAFLGTLLTSGIPVHLYPPFHMYQLKKVCKLLAVLSCEALILQNANARFLITFGCATRFK